MLVRDREIPLSKGYGYANVENRIPVDPERTVFRWGSVGKAFTAVAVMQLVEQGRLDLHADVNRYLPDFQLPGTFAQPVTLANLLTHTAGLDDIEIGYSTRTPSELIPLQEFLANHVPARVRPPGEVHSYCNICFDLAGCVVEASSGTPFAQYVEQHIFQPLGMDHTTFLRPLPPSLGADEATSYVYRDGAFEPVPWRSQRSNPGPAGTVRLWDVESGQIAGTLEHGNENGVHDVAFSPDGSLLTSGGTDPTVQLWDVTSGQVVHALRHGDALYGVAFSPDGSLLATACCDRTVKLCDVASGQLLRSLQGCGRGSSPLGAPVASTRGEPRHILQMVNL